MFGNTPCKTRIKILTYVTVLRLLTNEKIEHDEIFSAFNLLNYFVMRYEKLYSFEHLTYKIRGHLKNFTQLKNFIKSKRSFDQPSNGKQLFTPTEPVFST